MKIYNFPISSSLLLFLCIIITSCVAQEKPKPTIETKDAIEIPILNEALALKVDTDPQIGEYLVEVFEDSKGNLWFGTMAKGVARLSASGKDEAGKKRSKATCGLLPA